LNGEIKIIVLHNKFINSYKIHVLTINHFISQQYLESDIAQEDNFEGNSISIGGTEVLLGDPLSKGENR